MCTGVVCSFDAASELCLITDIETKLNRDVRGRCKLEMSHTNRVDAGSKKYAAIIVEFTQYSDYYAALRTRRLSSTHK